MVSSRLRGYASVTSLFVILALAFAASVLPFAAGVTETRIAVSAASFENAAALSLPEAMSASLATLSGEESAPPVATLSGEESAPPKRG